MHILKWLHSINPFRKITRREDAERIKAQAIRTIKQCEATIKQAEYLKHLAEHEKRAVDIWLTAYEGSDHG